MLLMLGFVMYCHGFLTIPVSVVLLKRGWFGLFVVCHSNVILVAETGQIILN